MDVITSGEVGPELEQYVNGLLDRIREFEAREAQLREAYQKDAERYAYLRRKVGIVGDSFVAVNWPAPVYVAPDAAIELDAAIDAALEAK